VPEAIVLISFRLSLPADLRQPGSVMQDRVTES